MDIKENIFILERDIKTMEGLLSEYRSRYRKLLQDIISSYALDGEVVCDAKAIYQKDTDDCTPPEYYGRGKYRGRLIILPTPDWYRPFSITFRTEETDDDGKAVFAHAFSEMTIHDTDPLELFKEYVLPYVTKEG